MWSSSELLRVGQRGRWAVRRGLPLPPPPAACLRCNSSHSFHFNTQLKALKLAAYCVRNVRGADKSATSGRHSTPARGHGERARSSARRAFAEAALPLNNLELVGYVPAHSINCVIGRRVQLLPGDVVSSPVSLSATTLSHSPHWAQNHARARVQTLLRLAVTRIASAPYVAQGTRLHLSQETVLFVRTVL
ncbi:hypothetical protein FA95DRAFT_1115218 [Auriscalpium vulgare]|uniref:Uncharacterized protein n=1 Tax=Auriscalpium vulgare TaxID=40419 RepID=A0ACB8R4N9_9AGAM|nr:hypothetical protein FA95DRAFT_1115218 [Auriscalpium vulgare]